MVADLEIEQANEVLDRTFARLRTSSGRRFLRENLVRFTEDGQEMNECRDRRTLAALTNDTAATPFGKTTQKGPVGNEDGGNYDDQLVPNSG